MNNAEQLSYPPGVTSPVVNLMEALGHNPEASLQFFNGSTGTGDEDMPNWDYLVDKDAEGARKWGIDHEKNTEYYESLGHALESATLGYAYDDPDPSVPQI
ncbi:hypothetical protein ABZW02_35340, partial [Streptomyces sp. NPDC005180]